jgi:leucyl/phenylalanyl-tRNA--protein transferase
MPTHPPPSRWQFPDPRLVPSDLVAVGADLEPGTILAAYRAGLFPMPVGGRRDRRIGWWSPDPRGVIPLDGLRVSRSLRKSCARFEIRVDTAFDEVLEACADPRRPHGWISQGIRRAYTQLHEMGWVHSVEAWSVETGELAGGLYGVAIGGLFAGESMFHRQTDASKVALAGLVDILTAEGGDRILDVQWATPHLQRLGAVELGRTAYLETIQRALQTAVPPGFDR